MHNMEQRSILRIIGNSRFWLLVVIDGGIPTKRMFISIDRSSSQAYKNAWDLISQYPVDPAANTNSALKSVTQLGEKVIPGFEIWDISGE